MKAKKQLLGFTAASLTLGAVFMAGGAPIPFYHTYAETLGLDKGVLSLATVAYFAGTVIALLFLPRLTNYWGRKRAIYLTLAFGMAGCFLFGNVTGEWRMLAARFMQGLSCGLASSTVAAFIIDNEPRRYKGLAAVIIGSAPNIGLPLGAMGSGVFNMFSDAIGMVFVIVAALLLCCGVRFCRYLGGRRFLPVVQRCYRHTGAGGTKHFCRFAYLCIVHCAGCARCGAFARAR